MKKYFIKTVKFPPTQYEQIVILGLTFNNQLIKKSNYANIAIVILQHGIH